MTLSRAIIDDTTDCLEETNIFAVCRLAVCSLSFIIIDGWLTNGPRKKQRIIDIWLTKGARKKRTGLVLLRKPHSHRPQSAHSLRIIFRVQYCAKPSKQGTRYV
jgi:hypothetical protein